MKKKRVYIETTIVSYLTARPTRDLILTAHQEITREWWEACRRAFELFVSRLVLDEAARGDAEAAAKRLAILRDLPELPVTGEATGLAARLLREGLLPRQAAADAMHLAMATVHCMDALLTWNCRHLANASILGEVGMFVRRMQYELPIVCTPDELMGESGSLGD
ncbi:MAG: type II toxin-antitoxin system VapC family toxin [Phycisphaerae bacterium]